MNDTLWIGGRSTTSAASSGGSTTITRCSSRGRWLHGLTPHGALVGLGATVHAFVRENSEVARWTTSLTFATADGSLRRTDGSDYRSTSSCASCEEPQGSPLPLPPRSTGSLVSRGIDLTRRSPRTSSGRSSLSSRSSTGNFRLSRSSTRQAPLRSTANVRESVDGSPRLRRRGWSDPPRALADQPEVDLCDVQVATDFLTMNYYDAFRARHRHMFNNCGPRQNPRIVTGTVITQASEARDDRARTTGSDAGLLPLH